MGIISESDDKLVFHVERLQDQIKILKKHMQTFDIDDVMVIVIPVDVRKSPQLEKVAYDIFTDYSKLHSAVVANSCTWYNRWVYEEYIRENMAYTYDFLFKNTETSLWPKCIEEYDGFLPIQQGGPLMLCLLLHRIQNYSEQALQVLAKQVSRLQLSRIEGEDVEHVVRLVKATYTVLRNASSRTHVLTFHLSSPRQFTNSFRHLQSVSLTTCS